MAMGSQQLAEDFGQLKDLLELYPNISIVKTDGQPPDNYEIEYNLRGYIKDNGSAVSIGKSHKIRISLPFGYPHFAPIAKPLTPIFHPDFDPAAIRIADRWQQTPSLPDLVLYIGEMISGNSYNLEDPFSPEAAEWYKAHKEQLPLDSLNIADIEEASAELDSLVDDTFASLGLENDSFLDPETPVDASEIEHIRNLMFQKKIFTANKLLAELPPNADFPDRDEFQKNIGKIFQKTDQLFKLAEQLEELGKLEEALEIVNNLLTIAVDVPAIDVLHSRIKQTLLVTQSLSKSQKKKKEIGEKIPDCAPAPPNLPPPKITKSPFRASSFPYRPLLALTLILGCGIGAISLYFNDQNVLSHSQADLLKGQLLIDKRQFDAALETLETAKTTLTDLTILRFRKHTIEQEINALIATRDLQEGLKGRVSYQGEYILAETANSLNELAVLTNQAQILSGENKIAEALTLYRQGLEFADKRGLSKQKVELKDTIQSLELRQALSLAEQAEQGKNWNEAAGAYRKALKLSGNIEDLGTTSDITHRLTAVSFRHEMDQSKKAFTQSQWQETIKFLEHAQQAMTANPNIATDKERQELHKLLINSKLYLTLSTAREAYQQKKWDLAINEYQNALTLLATEYGKMENTLDDSISKIEKTLMLVKLTQMQENILIAEETGNLPAVLAHCKEIQKLIRSSTYASEPTIKTVMQKINEKISKYQEQITRDERIAWLEEHYEEIFRANYPTFHGSKLLQPKAVFLKKVGNKTIFTISCLERSQGSSSKLELNYMFDAATGKWSVYHGQ